MCLCENPGAGHAVWPNSVLKRSGTMHESTEPANKEPVVVITGERVALGPMRPDLLPRYRHWMNDIETLLGYEMPRPLTDDAVADLLNRLSRNERTILFTLYARATMTPIGHAGLLHVDRDHRNGEFDLFIGDAASRGKGYGSEATRLVLEYAFRRIGLESVFLQVLEFNTAGIRVYEKAGFRQAGRLRNHWFVDGRFWDMVYMDCLAEEFRAAR